MSSAMEIMLRQQEAGERFQKIAAEYLDVLHTTVTPTLWYLWLCQYVRAHQFDGMTAS